MTEWLALGEFRPLFFPEMGWLLIALSVASLVSVVTGRVANRVRGVVSEERQVRTLVILAVVLAFSGMRTGWGLVRESRLLSLVGVFFGLVAVVPVAIITQRNGPKDDAQGPNEM